MLLFSDFGNFLAILLTARLVWGTNMPSGDSSLFIKSRQAPIHAYFLVYPWTPPVIVVSFSLTRRQLHLTALNCMVFGRHVTLVL